MGQIFFFFFSLRKEYHLSYGIYKMPFGVKIPCIENPLMLATTVITTLNGQETGQSGDMSRVTQPPDDKNVNPSPEVFP